MFYEIQPRINKTKYVEMLRIVGELSNLFSESTSPYLAYRAHENIFCRYLNASNLARFDCSADAKKDNVGIGLKTWTGRDDQKVAEFGRQKKYYAELQGEALVKKISEYRNERIRVTKNLHGIEKMIYHVVKREPGKMRILECAFDIIDIDNISIDPERGNDNNTYFSDDKHTYHFSVSKNTLYMIFDDLEELEVFEVNIRPDPFEFLAGMVSGNTRINDMNITDMDGVLNAPVDNRPKLCLPLYSYKKNKDLRFVGEKSGLNQWNAAGRKRDENEIYIPYKKTDRDRSVGFFPPKDQSFKLILPDGKEISAKVCQQEGKAIMSNPNKVLGEWLLRDVFDLPLGTIVTYEMLEKFGVDSVVFTKNNELDYSIEFATVGTYENMIEEKETDIEDGVIYYNMGDKTWI